MISFELVDMELDLELHGSTDSVSVRIGNLVKPPPSERSCLLKFSLLFSSFFSSSPFSDTFAKCQEH